MSTDEIRQTRTVWRGDVYRVYAQFFGGFKIERNLGGGNWEYLETHVDKETAIRRAGVLEAQAIVKETNT